MRLLLDTHALIWLAIGADRVPKQVTDAVADADALFVSVVSAWEHGIKRARSRGQHSSGFETLVAQLDVERLGFDWGCHVYAETLPPIHRDPFDRMLIAQALHHGLTLVTADERVRRYPVPTLW